MKLICRFFAGLLVLTVVWAQQYPEIQRLVAGKRFEEARAQIHQALSQNPDTPELYYWKAVVEWSTGQREAAAETLRDVQRRELARPPHLFLLSQIEEALGNPEASLQVLRELHSRYPSPRSALSLGAAEFKARAYDAAIQVLAPLEGKTPQEVQVQHLLGLAFMGKGDLAEAVSHLKKSAELEPEDASIRYDCGLALLQASQFAEASQQLREALRLKPDWAEAHLYLGRALHDGNLSEEAFAEFRKAQELNPQLPLLHHHFGLLHKGRGEYDEAVAEFEKEIASGRDYPPSFYHLAELLYNRQEKERAEELVLRAIQLDPDRVEFRLLAAKMALNREDYAAAETQITAALSLDPESSAAHYQKGRLLLGLNRPEEARAAFERSRQLADERSKRVPRP